MRFLHAYVVGLLLSGVLTPLYATEINVTTLQDINTDDGLCSLREAITALHSNAPSGSNNGECPAGNDNNDTLTLGAGTYRLSLACPSDDDNTNLCGDLDILADMNIEGAGMTSSIIDARPDDQSNAVGRVFDINPGAVDNTSGNNDITVSISDLTMQYGHAPDGQSTNDPGEGGGGLLIDTSQTSLTNVLLTYNSAGDGATGGSGGSGGGIETVFNPYSPTTLTIVDSQLSHNAAGNAGTGGDSGGSGGGLCSNTFTTLTMDHVTISQNSVGTGPIMGDGGGLCAYSSLAIVDSAIDNNVGQGIYSVYGPFTLLRSSVTNNTSDGIVISDAASSTTLALTNVTAANNLGKGIIVNRAIYTNAEIEAQLSFVTVSGNTLDGVETNDAHLTGAHSLMALGNSIVANNGTAASDDCTVSGSSVITGLGYNLYLTSSGCPTLSSTDVITDDPRLGPLASESGILSYFLIPYFDSPAINAGNCSSVINDQRSDARPDMGICDIGAIEIQNIIFQSSFDI